MKANQKNCGCGSVPYVPSRQPGLRDVELRIIFTFLLLLFLLPIRLMPLLCNSASSLLMLYIRLYQEAIE